MRLPWTESDAKVAQGETAKQAAASRGRDGNTGVETCTTCQRQVLRRRQNEAKHRGLRLPRSVSGDCHSGVLGIRGERRVAASAELQHCGCSVALPNLVRSECTRRACRAVCGAQWALQYIATLLPGNARLTFRGALNSDATIPLLLSSAGGNPQEPSDAQVQCTVDLTLLMGTRPSFTSARQWDPASAVHRCEAACEARQACAAAPCGPTWVVVPRVLYPSIARGRPSATLSPRGCESTSTRGRDRSWVGRAVRVQGRLYTAIRKVPRPAESDQEEGPTRLSRSGQRPHRRCSCEGTALGLRHVDVQAGEVVHTTQLQRREVRGRDYRQLT